MRRSSIPFEAIGLRSRLRGAVVVVHPAPQKDVTMTHQPDPNEPVVPPTDPVEETQAPPAVPADFEDDEEEIEGLDEDDDE